MALPPPYQHGLLHRSAHLECVMMGPAQALNHSLDGGAGGNVRGCALVHQIHNVLGGFCGDPAQTNKKPFIVQSSLLVVPAIT